MPTPRKAALVMPKDKKAAPTARYITPKLFEHFMIFITIDVSSLFQSYPKHFLINLIFKTSFKCVDELRALNNVQENLKSDIA
jgi:hypothetical protein